MELEQAFGVCLFQPLKLPPLEICQLVEVLEESREQVNENSETTEALPFEDDPTLNDTTSPQTSIVADETQTIQPTEASTAEFLTEEPTEVPTEVPTNEPTDGPTEKPTELPTDLPTTEPTDVQTEEITTTLTSTVAPSTFQPTSSSPTDEPTIDSNFSPELQPTTTPTSLIQVTDEPTLAPTTQVPTLQPTEQPTVRPITIEPTVSPTVEPTVAPTEQVTDPPTFILDLSSTSCDTGLGGVLFIGGCFEFDGEILVGKNSCGSCCYNGAVATSLDCTTPGCSCGCDVSIDQGGSVSVDCGTVFEVVCEQDDDCPLDLFCECGFCNARLSCSSDSDCGTNECSLEDEICDLNAGVCRPVDGFFCNDSRDCDQFSTRPNCDQILGFCRERECFSNDYCQSVFGLDFCRDGFCGECRNDADCFDVYGSSFPFCSFGFCGSTSSDDDFFGDDDFFFSECVSNSQCDSGFCDLRGQFTGQCTACGSDSDCGSSSLRPFCVDGICYECRDNSDCGQSLLSQGLPVCDTSSFGTFATANCRGCRSDSECTDDPSLSVCTDGRCVAPFTEQPSPGPTEFPTIQPTPVPTL